MAVKHTLNLAAGWTPPGVWREVVQLCRAWFQDQQVLERDAVVLLPFAALLQPLREAFAQAGGWQVRVETTLTLRAGLAPPPHTPAGCCCGDAVLDRLNAHRLLRSAGLLDAREAASIDHLVSLVVDAAQALWTKAMELPQQQRAAHWATARAAFASLAHGSVAAALEARLLGVALEWAASSVAEAGAGTHASDAAPSDALHALQPAAWVVVRLGGPDAMADATAMHSAAPALWLNLDPPLSWGTETLPWPAELAARAQRAPRWLCDDFEAEAQAAAALALDAVNAGRVPVALVAIDRALVRRVRVLLQRQQVPVLDETGWLLATTPEAAAVMALLQAALALQRGGTGPDTPAEECPASSRDAVLACLKSAPALRGTAQPEPGVDELEALWRGRRRKADRKAAQSCWRGVLLQLLPLASHRPGLPLADASNSSRHPGRAENPQSASTNTLQHWLQALSQALRPLESQRDPLPGAANAACGSPAYRQVWMALRLDGATPAFHEAALATSFSLAGFTTWVGAVLEQSPYLPPPDEDALVVLTPLARTLGRSFGQVVVSGADHQQLGAPPQKAALIGPQLARQLNLPDARQQHLLQRLALVHLLRGGPLTFTRRTRNEGEILSESPDLAWLAQLAGAPPPAADLQTGSTCAADQLPSWRPWQAALCAVPLQPVRRPRAVAAGALPQRLSASQLDALRQCPYRFFVRAVLRLDEPEELDAALAKRDYGNWLHEVLHRFHSTRDPCQSAAAQLQAAAAWATQQQALDEADLLPWRASFEHFCPAYLRWVAEREAAGWYWADGETEYERPSDELPGTRLRGRLDRLDHGPEGQLLIVDYKTGDLSALKNKVKVPLEDTQLVFYAALLTPPPGTAGEGQGLEVQACYLSLDDAQAPTVVAHPQVAASAEQMMAALAVEWQRLQAGEALQALGEAATCETCEARGLCRRDHWEPLNA
jgi:ATP-dependent helicase/nuclease subunit B